MSGAWWTIQSWGARRSSSWAGGSNLVLDQGPGSVGAEGGDQGIRLFETRDDAWIVEVGAGERWHDVVAWTLDNGTRAWRTWLIPGTTGAAPVQNIGAYGLEIKDRLESVAVMDLVTGRPGRPRSVALATGTVSSSTATLAAWRTRA